MFHTTYTGAHCISEKVHQVKGVAEKKEIILENMRATAGDGEFHLSIINEVREGKDLKELNVNHPAHLYNIVWKDILTMDEEETILLVVNSTGLLCQCQPGKKC